MAHSIIVLLVNALQFRDVHKRSSDSLCQMLLPHKLVETLHFPARVGLAFDGQHIQVASNNIIHLGVRSFGGILPIIQFMLRTWQI